MTAPETTTGTFDATEIDPMMEAIRQAIVDATGDVLGEFGDKQVIVVPPDETDEGIDGKIKMAHGKSNGLALLLVAGSGKNPDRDAPGPMVTVTIEAQLFVSTRLRARNATPVMALVMGLARFLHHARIEVSVIGWHEQLYFTGFDPLADDEFTAFVLTFERELAI